MGLLLCIFLCTYKGCRVNFEPE